MYWARLAGGLIAFCYLAVFLWTLKRRGADYFLDRKGKFKLLSVILGILFGVALAIRPPLAAPVFLVWVINGAVQSWADYFSERRRRR